MERGKSQKISMRYRLLMAKAQNKLFLAMCGVPKLKQEIDYIEEMDGQLVAVEFKWNPNRKAAMPLSFSRSYPDVDFKVVTRDNFGTFLL